MAYDVLVGVDTSDASRRAVQFACRWQAEHADRPLLLVHVVPWSPYSFNTPQENEQRHRKHEAEMTAANAQVLQPMQELAQAAGCAAETIVRHGDRVEILHTIAREESVGLIVVGRTGDSGIKERLFGGLASHLVQSSPVPVVVVP